MEHPSSSSGDILATEHPSVCSAATNSALPEVQQEGQQGCRKRYDIDHLSGTCHDHAQPAAEAGASWLWRSDPAAFKRGEGEFGCSHYRRRCKLVAPCCNEAYWCRHCHNHATLELELDVSKQHQLDRTKVTEVICALCNKQQPIGEECIACGVGFGAYSCLKCSFFEDDTRKEQFHCSDCGICRLGGQDNFFHCEKCACCYHVGIKGKHVCVEKSMHSNCPVCFEFLFDSCVPTSVLRCGHTIHSNCLKELTEARQTTCPICMRSYSDMTHVWKRLDEELARLQMPPEYANWTVKILCNDCHVTSTDRYHIVGQKCGGCGSYNTRRDTVISAAPEGQEGQTAQPDAHLSHQTGHERAVCTARASPAASAEHTAGASAPEAAAHTWQTATAAPAAESAEETSSDSSNRATAAATAAADMCAMEAPTS